MKTFKTNEKKAFTIIELLVVVSIIALLIGILLPAIGRARDNALQTRSLSNLRQLGTAHATYAAEWNDNQWTTGPHNLAQYGNDLATAVSKYKQAFNNNPKGVSFHPNGLAAVRLGAAGDGGVPVEQFWYDQANNTNSAVMPIDWAQGASTRRFGSYRMINSQPFNRYVSGRVYDQTFFAPKDRAVLGSLAECLDAPGEFCILAGGKFGPVSSSYILSPAAMFSPDLMATQAFTVAQAWQLPGMLRTPTFSQARYPDLKTHMLEHHWLQRTRRECNPVSPPFLAEYDDCAPYFFNATRDSVPATLFYDGHVEMLGVREALQANAQATTAGKGDPLASLWHNKTPYGPGGYYHSFAYTPPGGGAQQMTSYHILTRHGILGRDTFSR